MLFKILLIFSKRLLIFLQLLCYFYTDGWIDARVQETWPKQLQFLRKNLITRYFFAQGEKQNRRINKPENGREGYFIHKHQSIVLVEVETTLNPIKLGWLEVWFNIYIYQWHLSRMLPLILLFDFMQWLKILNFPFHLFAAQGQTLIIAKCLTQPLTDLL